MGPKPQGLAWATCVFLQVLPFTALSGSFELSQTFIIRSARGKSWDFDISPPRPASPHQIALTVRSAEQMLENAQGATVMAPGCLSRDPVKVPALAGAPALSAGVQTNIMVNRSNRAI